MKSSQLRAKLPGRDILEIVTRSESDLLKMYNSKILVLGGTGFIGHWLVSALCAGNRSLGLNASIHIGTRNAILAKKSNKFFEDNKIYVHNLTELNLLSNFDFLVHAATPSNPTTGGLDPNQILQSSNDVTANLLKIAQRSSCPSLMHLSSGIVYGESRKLNQSIPETNSRINFPKSAYTTAKLKIEIDIERATERNIIRGSNPRLFSFYGPLIDLSGHYAIGDFMRMGLQKGPIIIKGNPLTTRSYMYPTDLIVWLINILVNPSLTPTNVGSMHSQTIVEIASSISDLFGCQVLVEESSLVSASHYVPNCEMTKEARNLEEQVSFEDGLIRWKRWLES